MEGARERIPIIMSVFIEKAESRTLPLIALRGVVAFPGMTVNCDVQKDSFKSAAAAFCVPGDIFCRTRACCRIHFR